MVQVIVPICLENHYYLAITQPPSKKLHIWDSYHGWAGRNVAKNLKRCAEKAASALRGYKVVFEATSNQKKQDQLADWPDLAQTIETDNSCGPRAVLAMMNLVIAGDFPNFSKSLVVERACRTWLAACLMEAKLLC